MHVSLRLGGLLALLPLASCYQFEVHAQAAYAQLKVDGDLGYVNGSSSASIDQDFKTAFGIGEEQGIPYGRLSLDTGVPVIAVSGFVFEEQGQGVLAANFGNNLTANTPVRTNLELANAKGSYALQIGLGPVTISPGVALNYFDLHFDASDAIGIVTENVDVQSPMPMAFLRAELDLSIVSATAEVGYFKIGIDEVDFEMLDVEALVQLHPNSWLDLFVGYRMLRIAADGRISGDQFETDLTLSGFLVGGGLTF